MIHWNRRTPESTNGQTPFWSTTKVCKYQKFTLNNVILTIICCWSIVWTIILKRYYPYSFSTRDNSVKLKRLHRILDVISHNLFVFIFQLSLYRKLPWKTISRLWGQVHQMELPVWLRGPALGLYIWLFQVYYILKQVSDWNCNRQAIHAIVIFKFSWNNAG